MGSLDLILDKALVERANQLQHFDALDAKAGIILGFAGALVALTPGAQHLVTDFGRLSAVVAGLAALWAFLPRKYDVTNVSALRRKYLAAEQAFTKVHLLDSQIVMLESTAEVLRRKARRIKAAMVALATAVILVAIGIPLH
jgi:hypothetical protein